MRNVTCRDCCERPSPGRYYTGFVHPGSANDSERIGVRHRLLDECRVRPHPGRMLRWTNISAIAPAGSFPTRLDGSVSGCVSTASLHHFELTVGLMSEPRSRVVS